MSSKQVFYVMILYNDNDEAYHALKLMNHSSMIHLAGQSFKITSYLLLQ